MIENLFISIIVPVFGIEEKDLRRCLHSLCKQTYENYEILLIDDSNYGDYCGSICDEFAEIDDKIKTIHQENTGVSVARNRGMEKSRGNYICFVDPDDWVEEDMIEQMTKAVRLRKADLYIFSSFVNYKNKEIINDFWNSTEKQFVGKEKEKLQIQLMSKKMSEFFPAEIGVGVPWAKLYKKNIIEENNLLFDANLTRMQDNIFNMYLFEYAESISYSNSKFYHYNKNVNSATNKENENVIDYFERVNKEVEIFIAKFKKDDYFYQALTVKKLVGINSYCNLYFLNVQTKAEFKTKAAEYRNLLNKNDYHQCLKNIKFVNLTLKEKVFVFVLKTKSLRMMKLLQQMENTLKKLNKKELE